MSPLEEVFLGAVPEVKLLAINDSNIGSLRGAAAARDVRGALVVDPTTTEASASIDPSTFNQGPTPLLCLEIEFDQSPLPTGRSSRAHGVERW